MTARLSTSSGQPLAAVALATVSLVAAAALGSVFLSTSLTAWTAIDAAGPAGPADGILLLTALSGTLLSLWLGLGMALSALSALPGALGQTCRRLAARVAPAAMRKVVAFVLGTTLTAALVPGTAIAHTGGVSGGVVRGGVVATSRQASRPGSSGIAVAAPDASFRFVTQSPTGHSVRTVPHSIRTAPHHVRAVSPSISAVPPSVRTEPQAIDNAAHDSAPPPSWLPERPPSRTMPGARTGDVVVLRGDTLWSIAERHLGPTATAADIEAEWPRWLTANHEVIGDDADLILPGQLLRPPPAPRARS